MKKRAAVLLCLVLAVGLFCTAVAMGRTREVYLSEKDAAAYAHYEVDTAALPADGATVCDRLLALCTLETAGEEGDIYTSGTLGDYVPLCRTVSEISVSPAGLVTIGYEAEDSCEVYLTYGADSLLNKVVYDEASDTAFAQDTQPARLIKNFRRGGTTRYFHVLGLEAGVPLPAWWPGVPA